MVFKNMTFRAVLLVVLAAFCLIGVLCMKFFHKSNTSIADNALPTQPAQDQSIKAVSIDQTAQSQSIKPVITRAVEPEVTKEDSAVIQEQLDIDRQQQKQTKDLKIKLEQINLQLEQEKAIAEIDKLKKEDMDSFNDPAIDGQKNMPEIKVDYIGGNSIFKEAILSIGGVSYQVKEKSNPTGNIQITAISNSSVTVHISAPQDLTKTIDYKPE